MTKRGSKTDESLPENEGKVDFEVALMRLEEGVRLLEQGNLPLEQSLQQYADAVQLIATCQSQLEVAERKIEMLSGFDSAGNPVVRPIDSQDDLSLDEKQTVRSERRSAKPARSGSEKSSVHGEVEKDQRLF